MHSDVLSRYLTTQQYDLVSSNMIPLRCCHYVYSFFVIRSEKKLRFIIAKSNTTFPVNKEMCF